MTQETTPEPVEEQVESMQAEEPAAEDAPAKDETTATNSIADLKTKDRLQGTVKRVELQGAIIDLGMEYDGLLHISQLSEEPVKNVTDVIQQGDAITVYILAVDKNSGRIDLTMIEPPDLTWNEIKVNDVYTGTVERIEKYGVFINIGAERPGLIHVSELTTGFVNDPNEVVKSGDSIEAKVIGLNKKKKQIDLSVRALEIETIHEVQEDEPETLTAMEIAMRKAMGQSDIEDNNRNKRRRKKDRPTTQQEDIIARTLKLREG